MDSAAENMQWRRLPAMADRLKIGLRLERGLQYLHKTLQQDRIEGVLAELNKLSPSAVERLEYRFMEHNSGQRNRPVFSRCRSAALRCLRRVSGTGWSGKRRALAVPGT
ncbi:MAG: hypothetical protein HQ559_04075 [Lentisphaerae bacterium]|nr:hypothetical protein [Lentisphaerota bacterium]